MAILKANRGIIKQFFMILLLPLLFTSCILNKQIPDGANDFHSMMEGMIEKSYSKFEKNIRNEDVVLVSDFVNLNSLKNNSKLGFLLSDTLKNTLLNKNIYVREIELGKDFQIGPGGFTILSRDHKLINNNVSNERFAVVGTYTITTKRLIIFIKLMDITTGTILGSSSSSVLVDEEILDLEKVPRERQQVFAPVVL